MSKHPPHDESTEDESHAKEFSNKPKLALKARENGRCECPASKVAHSHEPTGAVDEKDPAYEPLKP